jgi:peptide/nickel transport system substrate-binding protein
MSKGFTRRDGLKGTLMIGAAAALPFAPASAQALRGGRLRVALLADIANFDPHQFSSINMPIMKNCYDSLIEYTPDGKAVPNLASAWSVAADSKSVTLTLRDDVKFHAGGALDAEAVAVNLKKCADPAKGKNIFPTMSIVQDWTVVGPRTIRLNFKAPVPEKQITDLLQFISIIDPTVIDTVETKAGGTGPFVVSERVLGQRLVLTANKAYWRSGEPVASEVVFTIFSDNDSASAALESGSVDLIYGGGARAAARLRNAGYQVFQGPGPLVQVFRINTTRGPFRNAKFRQAFNHLMDRAAILRVGYAGLGQVTALPWAPANPAFDASYNTRFAFDLDKARALLKESGLSDAEMQDWKILVDGGNQDSVAITQIVQGTLTRVGLKVDLDVKQGAEYVDALLTGKFAATFGGVGNVQKFPSRLTTNSIYRTVNNPILGNPHPHPEYVAAIQRVDSALGAGPDVKAAYDNLNKVLVETSFGVATNSYDIGLIVAAKNIGGVTLDIDNILVCRTMGFR